MRRAVARSLVVAALIASACCGPVAAGNADPTAATPSPADLLPSLPPTSPTPPFTPSEAREALHPDPNFDYGFVVKVTSDAFHPHWLVAVCCRPIIWENLTTETVTVVFDALGVSSSAIAPGGAWAFTPKNVESISYHVTIGGAVVDGIVQVNPALES